MNVLHGTPEEMIIQVLSKNWVDKSKSNALDTVCQYAEFLGLSIEKPKLRVFDNTETYVPTPDMVRAFLYAVTPNVRCRILIAVETGATASEIWRLTWRDFNFENKTLTIIGSKGHRTLVYTVSNELAVLLMQIPRKNDRIFFNVKDPKHFNDRINYYSKRLANETGNRDYLKIHFHSFRHFAISWKYFKTKDIVETQRFARHCNIQNTLRYVHIVKSWIKDDEYDVVYATTKEELTKFLSEGYSLVTTTEWGYCLKRNKSLLRTR